MGSSRVELFEAIRRDRRVDSLSVRALAERHGVHRRTVRQALDNADPLPRKTPVRRSARLESLKMLIDAMLQADLDALVADAEAYTWDIRHMDRTADGVFLKLSWLFRG